MVSLFPQNGQYYCIEESNFNKYIDLHEKYSNEMFAKLKDPKFCM